MEATTSRSEIEPHVEIHRKTTSQGTRGDVTTAFTINFDGDHPTTGNSGREKKQGLDLRYLRRPLEGSFCDWPGRLIWPLNGLIYCCIQFLFIIRRLKHIQIFSNKLFEAVLDSKWPQRPNLTSPFALPWPISPLCQLSGVNIAVLTFFFNFLRLKNLDLLLESRM